MVLNMLSELVSEWVMKYLWIMSVMIEVRQDMTMQAAGFRAISWYVAITMPP